MLGLLNVFAKFIPNYTEIREPFTSALKKGGVLVDCQETRRGFEKAKQAVAEIQQLYHLDGDREIYCDILYALHTTDNKKLTWERAMKDLNGEEKQMWIKAHETETIRLIDELKIMEPIPWREVPRGKKPSYCQVALEERTGKPKRVRMTYGGNLQQPQDIWTSRNSDNQENIHQHGGLQGYGIYGS